MKKLLIVLLKDIKKHPVIFTLFILFIFGACWAPLVFGDVYVNGNENSGYGRGWKWKENVDGMGKGWWSLQEVNEKDKDFGSPGIGAGLTLVFKLWWDDPDNGNWLHWDIPPDRPISWDWWPYYWTPGCGYNTGTCQSWPGSCGCAKKYTDIFFYMSGSKNPFSDGIEYKFPSACGCNHNFPGLRLPAFSRMDADRKYIYFGIKVPQDQLYFTGLSFWRKGGASTNFSGTDIPCVQIDNTDPDLIALNLGTSKAIFQCSVALMNELCPVPSSPIGNCWETHIGVAIDGHFLFSPKPPRVQPFCYFVDDCPFDDKDVYNGDILNEKICVASYPGAQAPKRVTFQTTTSDVVDPEALTKYPADMTLNLNGCPAEGCALQYFEVPATFDVVGGSGDATTIQAWCFQEDINNPAEDIPFGYDEMKVTVKGSSSWWQVGGGDVVAKESINNHIPDPATCGSNCSSLLIKQNPGIAIFGDNLVLNSPLNGQKVSEPNWQANSSVSNSYSYSSFRNKVDLTEPKISASAVDCPYLTTPTNGTDKDGYLIFERVGSLDISGGAACNLADNKIILFVDGNLTIKTPIYLTKGTGFFMAIVNGNITVDPSVGAGAPDLEGLFFANNLFYTGSATTRLTVRGSIVALGGVSHQRSVSNNNLNPAELFEFAPDLMFNFPAFLGDKNIVWQEVAP